jgi:hypothetical protein
MPTLITLVKIRISLLHPKWVVRSRLLDCLDCLDFVDGISVPVYCFEV